MLDHSLSLYLIITSQSLAVMHSGDSIAEFWGFYSQVVIQRIILCKLCMFKARNSTERWTEKEFHAKSIAETELESSL